MTHPPKSDKSAEEIAARINRDMDCWIQKQKELGTWPKLQPGEGQRHYALLVAEAITSERQRVRDEVIEECAIRAYDSFNGFAQCSANADAVAEAIRKLKGLK